jgi:hypothetical protein
MKRTLTLQTKFPSENPQKVRMFTEKRGNPQKGEAQTTECIISQSGVYMKINYLPAVEEPSRKEIVDVNIDNPITSGNRKVYNATFFYYDTLKEAAENGISETQNKNSKLLVEFLKEHSEISVPDKMGVNTNKNVKADTCRFELIDNTEISDNTESENLSVIAAVNMLDLWYKEDQDKLTSFAYMWGVKGLTSKKYTAKELFNILFKEVNANIEKFKEKIAFIEDEITVNVTKAAQIRKGNNFILPNENGHYIYNSAVVGKDIKEATIYFGGNPQEYTLLKADLNIKSSMPILELALPPVVEESVPEIKSKQLTAYELQNLEKIQDKLKVKFSDRIYRTIVEKQDVMAERVKGNQFQYLEDTKSTEGLCLQLLSETEELQKIIGGHQWFLAEVERVKREQTKLEAK